MIPANAELLRRRWPEVCARIEAARPARVEVLETGRARTLRIQGLQLSSAYDPVAEAELQARLVPDDATTAAAYGFATGELPRALLRRPALKRLDVVVMNPAVAAASCAHFDHTDWLADERVRLVPASSQRDLVAPFAAAPAELRLADEDGVRIRDLVALELATPHLKRHIAAREDLLRARLVENRDLVERDGDVGDLFGTRSGGTAIVAGAGPTLARHYARLAERGSDVPLLAVDACLAPLLQAGIRPDVVLTMESHREHLLPFFDCDLSPCAETPLVYVPVVHRDVLERWPGPRLVTYPAHARYDELRRELPRAKLWTSGTVFHLAVDLAVRMGAREVVFAGADFGHPGGRTHVDGSHHARHDAQADIRLGAWVVNGHGERIPSLPNLVGYLRELERFVAARPNTRFVNVERDGARIEGVAYAEETDG